MGDLDIIKQLEKNLNIKLKELIEISWESRGYCLNEKGQVTGLGLYCFKGGGGRSSGYSNTSSSEIENIIACISEFSNLTELYMRDNQICDISAFKKLKSLVKLDLSENQIRDISPLEDIKSIEKLFLSDNQISDISSLRELKKLDTIGLSNSLNQKKYSMLRFSMYASEINPYIGTKKGQQDEVLKNHISDISPLKNLKNLTSLYINTNLISDISPLKDLKNLTTLFLHTNQINDISPLKDLKSLTSLNLRYNPIETLPLWITDFNMNIIWKDQSWEPGNIILFDNPLKNPPIEIVKQGKEAIKRYFEKTGKEGIDYIYEAKLTIVGDGASGKTSLQLRLMDPSSGLPKEDVRTRGINIQDWNFRIENGSNHFAHIWDFGGQDVYHPVHRFFLTEDSVFVLLSSTRHPQHNFDYWIPTIFQFGGKSPVILGQTCHNGNKVAWNDIGSFLGNTNFNIIRTQQTPYYQINLPNNNEGLEAIKETIIEQILKLPHYGKGVPRSWIPVRERLAEMAANKINFISYERFEELCKELRPEQFTRLVDIEDCAQFLHSIGVILWYHNFDELRGTVILKPEWAMNAVYKLIDDTRIQNNNGIIFASEINRIWSDDSYYGKEALLKKMLEIFRIAFRKKHKDEYIIPARLLSMPDEKKWKDDGPYLCLEYKYEFMPKGLVNQLSAELSRYISDDSQVWNNAVNFNFDNNTARCQIEEDFYNRKITIRSKGKDARSMNMLVMDALKSITDGYKGVTPHINVPCSCIKCQNSNSPQIFSYDMLLQKISDNDNAKVMCNASDKIFPVGDLLFNMGLSNPVKETREKEQSKPVKIYIASSSELKYDRKEFEIAIRKKNDVWVKKGFYLEPIMWENFIDAMSKTRLQDEYNMAVKESDTFVMLFFTKVGKFTEEEFENAFGQFKEKGKPLIYVYFKDENKKSSNVNEEDTASLMAFLKKIEELGHYKTDYKNTESLILHFFQQLEKLEVSGKL